MPYNTTIPGYMNVASLKVLEQLASRVPPGGVIAEVGSFMGRSAWAFAKSCDPSVKVYCIDLWEKDVLNSIVLECIDAPTEDGIYDFEKFKKCVKDCPNIIPLRGDSLKVEWPEERKIDLLFIDASHDSPDVDNDIAKWLPRLKPEGVIAGHDFNRVKFPDVCRAVIATAEALQLPIKFYKESTIWAIELEPRYGDGPNVVVSTPLMLQQIKDVLTGLESCD